MKYERLHERLDYLLESYSQTKDVLFLMEEDCINHFFECEGFKTYEKIHSFAKEKGFKNIVDIGCAVGHQSEIFVDSEINYIGIDDDWRGEFWNSDRFSYLKMHYPAKIDVPDNSLGVSVLCLGWNCYLYEGDETLEAQAKALSEDFKHCLLYLPYKDKRLDVFKRYFKGFEIIESDGAEVAPSCICYFWN